METMEKWRHIDIYIPIWLDLLFVKKELLRLCLCHLHSNMVRFIISFGAVFVKDGQAFTFQYG